MCFLYHLNAYTYSDPKWFPDMDPKLRAMFDKVTRARCPARAGEKAKQDWKVSGGTSIPQKGRGASPTWMNMWNSPA
ncbi:MAG: hypothetical protein H6988_01650 [Pseudomonadales bacterium]|nr:hypothetical protein [Pseudomonadales bacterium]